MFRPEKTVPDQGFTESAEARRRDCPPPSGRGRRLLALATAIAVILSGLNAFVQILKVVALDRHGIARHETMELERNK